MTPTFDDRLSQTLLAVASGEAECRVFINEDHDLVLVWWTCWDGSWENDQGTKVPRAGIAKLGEFVLDHIPPQKLGAYGERLD